MEYTVTTRELEDTGRFYSDIHVEGVKGNRDKFVDGIIKIVEETENLLDTDDESHRRLYTIVSNLFKDKDLREVFVDEGSSVSEFRVLKDTFADLNEENIEGFFEILNQQFESFQLSSEKKGIFERFQFQFHFYLKGEYLGFKLEIQDTGLMNFPFRVSFSDLDEEEVSKYIGSYSLAFVETVREHEDDNINNSTVIVTYYPILRFWGEYAIEVDIIAPSFGIAKSLAQSYFESFIDSMKSLGHKASSYRIKLPNFVYGKDKEEIVKFKILEMKELKEFHKRHFPKLEFTTMYNLEAFSGELNRVDKKEGK